MRVVLAIASYNGDESVLGLVASAVSSDFEASFTKVAIVDSGNRALCSVLQAALADRYPEVEYQWHEGNLGAAGNLFARLQLAKSAESDALMAVNADGRLDANGLQAMIKLMEQTGAAGVYPTAVIEGDRVDLSYRKPVPILPSRYRLKPLGSQGAIKVTWGSSNGALYRVSDLAAVPMGPVLDLWHGWEDLAVGLAFRSMKRPQFMSLAARQPTASDQRRLGGYGPIVSSKAPWTTYYTTRNLVLIARHYPSLAHRVVARILREFVIIAARDCRCERYRLALLGLADGARGRGGRQVEPH